VESVWASPVDVEISREQAVRLGRLLDLSGEEILRKVTDTQRDFVYLKRHLDPEAAAKVMALKVPGLFLRREYRRYYPAGEVMSHMLGFTDVDDKGQEGLELAFQESLQGKPGSRHVIRDRKGHIIEDVESIKEPQDGKTLALAIDQKIQYLAFRELKSAIAQHKAKAGAIVVLDSRTGELLALANFPTYNPNNRGKLNRQATRNRAITDLFEPGSTIKPITAAVALETGKFKPGTPIQTAPGQLTIGRATIHDAHPNGMLTVAQVIQKSSNVGAARMALALPAETLHDMFKRLGFGDVPNSGFPGEAAGRVRDWKKWVPIEQATMSYGHGISVSLLQLARAYTIFAGEGELKPVVLTKQSAPAYGQQVISPETARAVRAMLELAVQPGGTAPKAQVVGYRVAGKTGTAHKQEGNGYADNRYVSSFVGLAPVSDPRLVVAVMIDEPSNGQYYGGAVAAPVFSSVMAGALRLLSVAPDAPTDRVLIPADAPEVKEMI
jgi:cell division protein FtsI (penicillin-binding protein 3)